MTPEQFLTGRLTGFGCALGFTGRVLRRYSIDMIGAWSEEHRALHLDETYTYVGREDDVFRRSWVLHTDEEGYLIGYDAHQAARLRGRLDGPDLRLTFDRPIRPGGPLEPSQKLRVVEINAKQVIMVGRVAFLGIPIATLHTALIRTA